MRCPTFPRYFAALCTAAFFLAAAATAPAQVIVYKLFFETTGKTLNYEFYDGGYFVCDAPNGTGTFVLTVRAADHRRYYNAEGSGEIFYINDGNKRLAVLKASAATIASYQATGEIDGPKSIGAGFKMPFARELDGYMLASQEEGDAVLDDDGDTRTEGFAGYSRMKLRFEQNLTGDYNADYLDVGGAVDAIAALLERRGYVAENEDDDVNTTSTTVNTGATVAP